MIIFHIIVLILTYDTSVVRGNPTKNLIMKNKKLYTYFAYLIFYWLLCQCNYIVKGVEAVKKTYKTIKQPKIQTKA